MRKIFITIDTIVRELKGENRVFFYNENSVEEDGLFDERVVARRAAFEVDGKYFDLRSGKEVKLDENQVVTRVFPGTVFSFSDGTRQLLTRFVGGNIGLLSDFVLTRSMNVVPVVA